MDLVHKSIALHLISDVEREERLGFDARPPRAPMDGGVTNEYTTSNCETSMVETKMDVAARACGNVSLTAPV